MAGRRGGYAHLQATRPQTLACGLADSLAELAAWITEKFWAWSDCDGDGERRLTKDELLTTITLYWVTGTTGSSFLFYFDSQRDPGRRPGRVEVPVGVALFPIENPVTGPREWAETTYNITRWTQMPPSGHFRPQKSPSYSPASCESSSAHSGNTPAPGPQRAGGRARSSLGMLCGLEYRAESAQGTSPAASPAHGRRTSRSGTAQVARLATRLPTMSAVISSRPCLRRA